MAGNQHEVWETIAASFDRTRQRTWPHVESFIRSLPGNSRVLDLMAGNGRHTQTLVAAGHQPISLDWSRPALQMIRDRLPNAEVVAGDAILLPFADQSIDACVYVAGLHSIPLASGRAESLRELHRVLRLGGLAQITVWSRHALRFAALGLPPGPADVTIPWRADGHDAQRFYHLYDADELRAVLTAAGFILESLSAVAIASPLPDNLVAVVRAE